MKKSVKIGTKSSLAAKAPKATLGPSSQAPSGLMDIAGAKKNYAKSSKGGMSFDLNNVANVNFGTTGLSEDSK